MKKPIFLLFALLAFAASITANADPAYYLIGQFNEWDENAMVPFVAQEDGSFTLTQTFSGEFKVKDENGNWLGGAATTEGGNQCALTYANPSATLIDGKNFFIDGAYAEYTLTITEGKLTVTGLPEPAYYLYGEQFNDWKDAIPFTKLIANHNGVPSYTLSRKFSGEFKIVDEYGHWYGGNTDDGSDYWLTPEHKIVSLSTSGSNFYIDGEASAYTLTIADGVIVYGVPIPLTPDPDNFEWYDYAPFTWPDGQVGVNSAWFFIGYGMDFMQNLVANDYSMDIDDWDVSPLSYIKLDPSKYSYSIYTDYNQLFTFDPEVYSELTQPTTDVFIFNLLPETGSTTNFEFWGPHFPGMTNQVGDTGWEPFFKYRIGMQAHYTVDGETLSSDIAWYGELPPTLKGDVNLDGSVDVADINILVNIILGKDSADKYDGRAYVTDGDTDVDVSDVNAVVNIVLGNTTE